jgi:hypothetical protein
MLGLSETSAVMHEPSVSEKPRRLSWTVQLHPASERSRCLSMWRRLEPRLAHPRVMASADWTETWLDHYGQHVPHQFATLEADGDVQGICLLTSSATRFLKVVPVASWHIGTSGEGDCEAVCVEYNALICDPDLRETFFRKLLERFDRDSTWDELQFEGFLDDDLNVPSTDTLDWSAEIRYSRYFDLQRCRATHQEPIALLGKSTRKHIRQDLRHYGTLSSDWAETVGQAQDIFRQLQQLHQARWQSIGQPGCYSSRRFTAFHEDLLTRLVPQQKMVLFRIRHGTTALGCSQMLVEGRRLLVYQGGRLPEETHRSPGLLTDYLCIQQALERGFDAYDYLAGDSLHKQRVTTDVANLVWATARRRRWKFRVMNRLKQLRGWLRCRVSPPTAHRGSEEGVE